MRERTGSPVTRVPADSRKVERQLEASIKVEAKRDGRKEVCKLSACARAIRRYQIVKTLAKDLVRARKFTTKMYTARAHMRSVSQNIDRSVGACPARAPCLAAPRACPAMASMTKAFAKSVDITRDMNALMGVREVHGMMQGLQREMAKAGVIEEMFDDAVDGMDDDDVEDLADEEVTKVLLELTNGIFGDIGPVGGKLPASQEQEDADLRAMRERLEAIGRAAT